MRTNKSSQFLLIIMICLSLLTTQGITLHGHNLDHSHDIDHQTEVHNHHPVSDLHFAHDTTHGDHHDKILVQYDLNDNGVFKTLVLIIFFPALLLLLLLLVPLCRKSTRIPRQRETSFPLTRFYIHSPPLRAPPRH